jgi:membrane protein DedA with SNARE-associated domain
VSPGKVVALVAAVALVAWALRRRRRLGRGRFAATLVLAAVLGAWASGVLPPLPDAKTAIEDVAKALGPWTYALVGAAAFLETGAFVGLVAPGETTVLVGGVIAGQGEISLIPLIGIVWICAVLGDTTSFFVGRRLGRQFLVRHGPKVKITEERLHQVEGYFQRHGGKTILIGRFIGLVRAVAPFIAGASGMAYRSFIPYSIVGTGLWGTLYCVLGYVFYRSFDRVAKLAGQATLAFGVVVAVVVGTVYAYRRLRREEDRRRLSAWLDRQEAKPALRPAVRAGRGLVNRILLPAWRVAQPRLGFLWGRLTPGGLGLGFTTALAVAGAGLYVFTLYAVILAGDPGLTPLDRETLDLSDQLRARGAVDAAKLVTDLGALPTVTALAAAAVVVLAVRRHWIELTSLLAGAVLVYVGVHLAKAGIDRPRPPAPLVHTAGDAFPSGHAAYSSAWVAVAVVASRALPGLASRATLVLATLAISAAVGLSRIYLHAHYWSDVAGGWGLGYGIFATCAVVGLIVGHIRHNGGTTEAAEPAASAARR